MTKRMVLSELAKVFDPIGFTGALLIRGKILMQKLWQTGIGWDESLCTDVGTEWRKFFYWIGTTEWFIFGEMSNAETNEVDWDYVILWCIRRCIWCSCLTNIQGGKRMMEPTAWDSLLGVSCGTTGKSVCTSIWVTSRCRCIQTVMQRWSKNCQIQDVLPLLVPRRKWNIDRRNVKVDDVVLVAEQNLDSRQLYCSLGEDVLSKTEIA